MSDFTHAYVAIEKCGCVSAITADTPDMRKDNAKEIARWIREGRTVERLSADEARERFCRPCTCGKGKK